jgi:hypothetical protein
LAVTLCSKLIAEFERCRRAKAAGDDSCSISALADHDRSMLELWFDK